MEKPVFYILLFLTVLCSCTSQSVPATSIISNNSTSTANNNTVAQVVPIKNQQIVNWRDASKYIGQQKTVEGTIVTTRYLETTKGKPTFLNFNNPYKGFFTCLIWGSDRPKFIQSFSQNPETFLLKKLVQVTGLIQEYPDGSGYPEMILTDPSQMQVIKP